MSEQLLASRYGRHRVGRAIASTRRPRARRGISAFCRRRQGRDAGAGRGTSSRFAGGNSLRSRSLACPGISVRPGRTCNVVCRVRGRFRRRTPPRTGTTIRRSTLRFVESHVVNSTRGRDDYNHLDEKADHCPAAGNRRVFAVGGPHGRPALFGCRRRPCRHAQGHRRSRVPGQRSRCCRRRFRRRYGDSPIAAGSSGANRNTRRRIYTGFVWSWRRPPMIG